MSAQERSMAISPPSCEDLNIIPPSLLAGQARGGMWRSRFNGQLRDTILAESRWKIEAKRVQPSTEPSLQFHLLYSTFCVLFYIPPAI